MMLLNLVLALAAIAVVAAANEGNKVANLKQFQPSKFMQALSTFSRFMNNGAVSAQTAQTVSADASPAAVGGDVELLAKKKAAAAASYLNFYLYSASAVCSGKPDEVVSMKTDTCFPVDSNASGGIGLAGPTGSYKVSVADSKEKSFFVTMFSDSACLLGATGGPSSGNPFASLAINFFGSVNKCTATGGPGGSTLYALEATQPTLVGEHAIQAAYRDPTSCGASDLSDAGWFMAFPTGACNEITSFGNPSDATKFTCSGTTVTRHYFGLGDNVCALPEASSTTQAPGSTCSIPSSFEYGLAFSHEAYQSWFCATNVAPKKPKAAVSLRA